VPTLPDCEVTTEAIFSINSDILSQKKLGRNEHRIAGQALHFTDEETEVQES
jgi:hypothetical protein